MQGTGARYLFVGTLLFYFYSLNVLWPPDFPEYKAVLSFFQLGVLGSLLVLFDYHRHRRWVVACMVVVYLQVILYLPLDQTFYLLPNPYTEFDLKMRGIFMVGVTVASIAFSLIFYQRVTAKAEERINSLLADVQQQNLHLQDLQKEIELYADRLQDSNEQLRESLASTEASRHALSLTHNQLRHVGQLKDELTAMVVYDLKNPLNAILAMTDTPPDANRLIGIRWAGQQMMLLVSNLLDIQRYEEARIDIHPQRHYLAHLVDSALRQVDYLFRSHRVEIDCRYPPNLALVADGDLLVRVLVNLLTNALKHAPAGDCLRLEAQLTELGGVRISLTDHGPGVPPELTERIFEKFVYGKASTAGFRNSGLGLAFCRIAIEAQGGGIGLRSVPHQATTFEFWLPNADTDGPVPAPLSRTDPDFHDVTLPLQLHECPEVARLRSLPVYEISLILDELDSLPEGDPAVSRWKQAVTQAALECHEDNFRKLLA